MKFFTQWPVLCGLLSILMLAQNASAGQDYYINNDVVTNPGNIDATNFINNGSFTVTYSYLYETADTLNYINNDTMISSGGGFQFDTLSGGTRYMASSFYNPGSITSSSSSQSIVVGTNTITLSTAGQVLVSATNLVNPGQINVGANGLLQLTGQNIDLSYGSFTIQQGTPGSNPPFGVVGTGSFGTDTNAEWDPSIALTKTNATSSKPNVFTLVNPQCYVITNASSIPSNNIIRVVFLRDTSPYTNEIATKVYFGSSSVGGGFAHVEWDGLYFNPATGQFQTNYLYLSNDYVQGTATNLSLIGGIPANFTFSEGLDATLTNPAVANFPVGGFPAGAITNPYSYTLAQLIATSVTPGSSPSNPSGALTNLPARTQISASRELNLALATITGQNYLSLTCTNQFDGNVGAEIVAPFSDINLGVTNGFLTVSNLLQSVIPSWYGSVQAWSTEFFYTDTNTGITNDFRVLIVGSSLYPSIGPFIQNLTLHATNLVISDSLAVISNALIDAQSLTLTANNGFGYGAGSPDGELIFSNKNTLFTTSLPNLLWLTNNGTIVVGNAANFGGPSPQNYKTFINNGIVSDQGSTIYSTYFQNGGIITNGLGNFNLQSQTAILTNSLTIANGDVSITTSNLIASGSLVQAGRSLTLLVTNLLTDNGLNNYWYLGASSLVGLNLPIKPVVGDLLGTTISLLASANKNVVNTWSGVDWGISSIGYFNNVAVGNLILDASSIPPRSLLTFTGTGTKNAIYVKNLLLTNNAATLNSSSSSATALSISPNMVIYYQQAYSNGVSVSSTINGWNNNRLRWVTPAVLAQTNIVVPPPSISSNGFNFTVSGVLLPNVYGSATNYNVIVQTATNLTSPTWVNVYTSTPPFTYTNLGYTTNPQQFYRAKQGW